jgi:hypothetical protein
VFFLVSSCFTGCLKTIQPFFLAIQAAGVGCALWLSVNSGTRTKPRILLKVPRNPKPLRIGFLPVNDCAPLVVASELNLFKKYGLNVELVRESSCAAVRDKVIQPLFGSNIFYRYKANEPTEEKAAWLTSHLFEYLSANNRPKSLKDFTPRLRNVFQPETFAAARRKATRNLKLIESGASNLQTLRRPGFWVELKMLARHG